MRLHRVGCDREVFASEAVVLLHETTLARCATSTVSRRTHSVTARKKRKLVERDVAARVIESEMPVGVTGLQFYIPTDGELEVQGFVGARHMWTAEGATELDAVATLSAFAWGPDTGPWCWAFLAGCFALAVACALDDIAKLGVAAKDREIVTCVGCSGEQVALGVLRKSGMSFFTRAEELSGFQ